MLYITISPLSSPPLNVGLIFIFFYYFLAIIVNITNIEWGKGGGVNVRYNGKTSVVPLILAKTEAASLLNVCHVMSIKSSTYTFLFY